MREMERVSCVLLYGALHAWSLLTDDELCRQLNTDKGLEVSATVTHSLTHH